MLPPDLLEVGVARGLAGDLGEFAVLSALELGVIEDVGRRRAHVPIQFNECVCHFASITTIG